MDQHQKDKLSEYYCLYVEIRNFLLSKESVEETKKPRITTFSKNKKGICHLRTMPNGVDLGFLKGARLEDVHNRLTGTGKAIRVLSLNTYNEKLIDYYLQQAIGLTET